MYCCSRSYVNLNILSRNIIRTMVSYGIETHQGLYLLTKRGGNIEESTSCPEILCTNLDILHPSSKGDIFNKLTSLKSLFQSLSSNGVYCYKGFLVDDRQFERAICLPYRENNTEHIVNESVCKRIKFTWNGEYHVLESSADSSEVGKEFILTKSKDCHPIANSKQYAPQYSSFPQVYSALNLITENDNTLDILPNIPSLDKNLMHSEHALKHPFVVIEGLDGTGKSTLVNNLAKRFNGKSMATPPPSISGIRRKFDHLPELYRRAYYGLGNYVAAEEVLQCTQTQTVIMDRYWHSTTSYAIANEVGSGLYEYLPPKGHALYEWPKDLLYPSAIIFLTTEERDRDTRVNERKETTKEEKDISADNNFRARIMETYRRIGHKNWIEVDTSGTKEQTLEKAVKSLLKLGFQVTP